MGWIVGGVLVLAYFGHSAYVTSMETKAREKRAAQESAERQQADGGINGVLNRAGGLMRDGAGLVGAAESAVSTLQGLISSIPQNSVDRRGGVEADPTEDEES